jgi:hypothetical protein
MNIFKTKKESFRFPFAPSPGASFDSAQDKLLAQA